MKMTKFAIPAKLPKIGTSEVKGNIANVSPKLFP